jgi:hypothetical protein
MCKHLLSVSEKIGAFLYLALADSVIVCINVLETPVTSDIAFQQTTNWPKQKLKDIGEKSC